MAQDGNPSELGDVLRDMMDMSNVRHLTGPAAALTVALLVAACGGVIDGDATPDALDGDWTLTAGEGPAGPVDPPASHPVTLTIDGEDWGGTAACNLYGGTADIDGSQVRIRELFQTEMACLDDGVMEAEAAYLTALADVSSFEVSAERLVLRGAETELTFARQPPVEDAALVGTRWEVVTLFEGDGPDGVASQATGGASLHLAPDGVAEVATGCVELSGRYVLEGDELRIVELPIPDLECPDPDASTHAHIVRVLLDPVEVEVEGRSLSLWGPAGEGLGLRAEQ